MCPNTCVTYVTDMYPSSLRGAIIKNIMKSFIKAIYDSVTSKDWYARILAGETPNGILYAIFLNLLIGIVITIFLSIEFFNFVPKMRDQIVDAFPADLELVVASGTLSMNQPSPYIVPVRERFFREDEKFPANIIVIDTSTSIATVEQFDSYDTSLYITSTDIAFEDGRNGTIGIYKMSSLFPDMTINRVWIANKTAVILSYAWIVPIAIFFLYALYGTISVLVMSLLYALLVWGIVYALGHKKSIGYKKAYSITLYASTLPTLVGMIGPLLPISPDIDILDSSALYVVILLALVAVMYYVKGAAKTVAGTTP
jgi:Protein of unknown function (DUF1189)